MRWDFQKLTFPHQIFNPWHPQIIFKFLWPAPHQRFRLGILGSSSNRAQKSLVSHRQQFEPSVLGRGDMTHGLLTLNNAGPNPTYSMQGGPIGPLLKIKVLDSQKWSKSGILSFLPNF